jgi:hypothetical protein
MAAVNHHDQGRMVADEPSADRPAAAAALHPAGAAGGVSMQGTPCSATPPSPGLAALVALLAVGLLIATPALRPSGHPAEEYGPRRRGPPRSGALLLHDLCVSRT